MDWTYPPIEICKTSLRDTFWETRRGRTGERGEGEGVGGRGNTGKPGSKNQTLITEKVGQIVKKRYKGQHDLV